MELISDLQELQKKVLKLKKKGKCIGFVPTMGALHDGHLSLVKAARKENDILIASIYVNPTQFGPKEDLSAYPRTFEADKKALEKEKVDILFFPDDKSIYQKGYATYVEVEGDMVKKLCGAKRPGHFKGVTTIVSVLFLICQPDRAYFGLKDYQQQLIIKRMIEDLKFPIKIISLPIVREKDGLALSSRNKYLSGDERKEAVLLNKSLLLAKEKIEEGQKDVKKIKTLIKENIQTGKYTKIDYIAITDPDSLEDLKKIENRPVLIALAVYVGKARLIDNMMI